MNILQHAAGFIFLSLLFFRTTSEQMIENLLKVEENVNVPMTCPAAKKPQQIVAAQPKQSVKPKVHTQQIPIHGFHQRRNY